MSKSREYRKEAAQQIRRARKISDPDHRRERLMLAHGLKTLAAAEEWLEGSPQKSAPRSGRRRNQPSQSLQK